MKKNFTIKWFKNSSGQALMELLVGVGIGAIILGSTVGIARVSVRSNSDVRKMKTATFLAKEIEVNLEVFADANWNGFYGLSKGENNHYYLTTTSSPFVSTSGEEIITQDGVPYKRYFYVENVYRSDSNDSIVSSGGSLDPSTQKTTIKVTWQGEEGEVTLVNYLARYRNFSFNQSDWFGGYGIDGPLSFSSNVFSTSTTVSVGTAGVLKLQGY
ncbi:MAG: hypothetical protein PHZ25_02910 [Candidatus Pacebacteria bacterium]|nr:hypothetical protein [Candidatus Paceibacterota bacterium]